MRESLDLITSTSKKSSSTSTLKISSLKSPQAFNDSTNSLLTFAATVSSFHRSKIPAYFPWGQRKSLFLWTNFFKEKKKMVQTRFAVWILVISLFLNVLFAHSSQNVWATPRISPKQVFVPPTLHSKDYNLREFETFSLLITNPQLELDSIFGFKKICSVNSNVEPFLIRLSKGLKKFKIFKF